jgi:hypothetical protein
VFTRPMCAAILLAFAVFLAGCGFRKDMSADAMAKYFQKTTSTPDMVCTTHDTNGWKYSCSYTGPDGSRWKVGATPKGDKLFRGSGAVPINEPLPPSP